MNFNSRDIRICDKHDCIVLWSFEWLNDTCPYCKAIKDMQAEIEREKERFHDYKEKVLALQDKE